MANIRRVRNLRRLLVGPIDTMRRNDKFEMLNVRYFLVRPSGL